MRTLQPERDNAEIHIRSCGVLRESADRVCIQFAERASTEHRRSGVPRNHAAHSLHSQAILKGFGVTVEAVVLSDASAGIGMASRQGCGRLKHLEVQWLWVQEKVSEKALRLRKHPTETNTAGLAAKYLTRPLMEMLLAAGNVLSGDGSCGEYFQKNSEGTNGEYIVIDFEVKLFTITEGVFLCVG